MLSPVPQTHEVPRCDPPPAVPRRVIVRVALEASSRHLQSAFAQLARAREEGHDAHLLVETDDPAPPASRWSWLRFVQTGVVAPPTMRGPLEQLGVRVSATYTVERTDDGTSLRVTGIDGETWGARPVQAEWPARHSPARRLAASWWIPAMVVGSLGLMVSSLLPAPKHYAVGQPPVPVSGTPGQAANGELAFGVARISQARWLTVPIWETRRLLGPVNAYNVNPSEVPEEVSGGTDVTVDDDVNLLAWLAAAKLAGRPAGQVSGSGALVVLSPPGDELRPGDVIVEVDGKPVRSLHDVNEALESHAAGDQVPVLVRGGRRATLRLQPSPFTSRGFELPQALRTHELRSAAPKEIKKRLELDGIDGPSYGLAMALRYYQDLTGEDLLQGRRIVATGAITETGDVEPVNDTSVKAAAAREHGATMLLVPELSLRDTYAHGTIDGLDVHGVATLEAAVRLLRLPPTPPSRQLG